MQKNNNTRINKVMDLVDVCNFDVEETTNRVLSITYSIVRKLWKKNMNAQYVKTLVLLNLRIGIKLVLMKSAQFVVFNLVWMTIQIKKKVF